MVIGEAAPQDGRAPKPCGSLFVSSLRKSRPTCRTANAERIHAVIGAQLPGALPQLYSRSIGMMLIIEIPSVMLYQRGSIVRTKLVPRTGWNLSDKGAPSMGLMPSIHFEV